CVIRGPLDPADPLTQSAVTAFLCRLCRRIPTCAPWNASSPRSPPRSHLRFPAPAGTRADIQWCPDHPPDARKSSLLLRTATRLSIADRSPPHALGPPRSPPP